MVIPTIFIKNKYIPTSLLALVMGWHNELPTKLRMLDLFSGLGGASEAMLQSDNWEVIRVENNEELLGHVPRTFIFDVKDLAEEERWRLFTYDDLCVPDLIWASPPCLGFSTAYAAPRSIAQRNGEEYHPDLSLVIAAVKLIDYIQPDYYCIENVKGSIKYIEPILGPPTQIIGPFVLWHNMPSIIMPQSWSHRKSDGDTWSSDPLRPNRRALIPYDLSNAVRIACESPTLWRWQ